MPDQRKGIECDDGDCPPIFVGDESQTLYGPVFLVKAACHKSRAAGQ